VDWMNSAGSTLFLRVSADASGASIESQGYLIVETSNVERARWVTTALLFGKTTSDLDATGVEIYGTGSSVLGSVRSTTAAAAIQNVYCRHMSSADAGGEDFVVFTRTSSATTIGSIDQVSTTGVAYNTTSDARLKTVLRDLDDEEIAEILRLIAPVVFEFNEAPGVEHVGFIAQQLAEAWPQFVDVGIVTPGRGEPGDDVKQREIRTPVRDANGDPRLDEKGQPVEAVTYEPVPGTEFKPWMVDLSKLTPLLVAGWQALDRRLAVLEAA
jgi:hypothetical protein